MFVSLLLDFVRSKTAFAIQKCRKYNFRQNENIEKVRWCSPTHFVVEAHKFLGVRIWASFLYEDGHTCYVFIYLYMCRCIYMCVDMYMCMNMIVSGMSVCACIAFVCTLCTAL